MVEEVAATVEVEVPVTVINNITNTTIVQAPEVIQRQCSDGKNNDDDSFIDFPADPGCENADDDTEDPNPVTRITTECSDGIDNDGNGFTDYPEDQGCTNENDNTESPALETIISVETVEQSLEEAIISANNCLVKTSKDKSVTLADLEEDDPAQEMLNALTNIAYGEDPIIVGRLIDGEYHFEGDKPILRPEFFKLAAWPSCLEQSAESQGIWSTGEAKEFKDPGFDEDFWAFEIINGLAQLDVVSGYEDGTVGLDKQITRAEIVKLLLDAFALRTYLDEHGSLDLADYDKNAIFKEVFADSLSEYEENPFTDVSNLNKPWYYNYSIVAYDKKITQGIEGMFKGDEPATRLEAATMIYNFFMVNVEEQVTEEVVEEVKEITFVRTFIPARYGSF